MKTPSPSIFRVHGTIEPVRSQIVTVPRLTGSGTGPMVIVRLAKVRRAAKHLPQQFFSLRLLHVSARDRKF